MEVRHFIEYIIAGAIIVLLIWNEMRKKRIKGETSHKIQIFTEKPIRSIGAVLLIFGIVLSFVQLFLKEDITIFGSSIGSVPKLDESYLYIGLALAIMGVIFIVGDIIKNPSQQTTTSTASPSVNVQPQSETEAAESSIPKQIEQLAKLRDQGILSEAEFEEKKKQLLSRL
jgi:hypothetical protein